MTELTDGPGRPIDKVRAGMRVVDADGDTVGTVTHVATGDTPAGGGLPRRRNGWTAEVFAADAADAPDAPDAPDVVDGQADRLMSGGYLKVIGTGVNGVDRYIAADEITEVDDPTVILRVDRDQLMIEQ